MVDAFLIALQFLTRIPVKVGLVDDRLMGHSVLYYPFIGLLLGGVLVLLAGVLLGRPFTLQAALILSIWVWLSGGLHLDGLADCADAWVGGLGDRHRTLAIMKDPASGPIGVSVLVLVLLLKYAALIEVLEQQHYEVLVMSPILGRSAILFLMLTTPYVRPKGLADALLQHLPRYVAGWVAVGWLALALVLISWSGLLLAGAILLWLRHAAMRRLGGVTGDVYGAAVEIVETGLLVGVALW